MTVPHRTLKTPSRKRAVIFNLLSHYTGIVLLVVQGIVLVPLYLKYIDARLYGAWLATGSIMAYLGLLDLGFFSIIVQKVANMAGKKDEQHLGALVGTGLLITSALALFPMLFGWVISPYVAGWVKIQGPGAGELAISVLAASASTSLMFLSYGYGGILVGLQWAGVVSGQFIISNILGIVATVIFLYRGWGVSSIAFGLLVRAGFLAVGHVGYLLFWVSRNLSFQRLCFKLDVFKDIFKGSVWIFFSRMANTAASQSDNLIVAAMLDPRLTTVLALTKKAADIIVTVLMRIPSSFMPGIAHLAGEADKVKLRKYMVALTKIVSVIGIWGLGGTVFLNQTFVTLWVGPEFYGGLVLTVLIAIACFLLVFNTVLYHNIFAAGEIPTAAKATILEAVLRIPLSIFLCYAWGIKGVVLAGILAALPSTSWMQIRCFLRVLNLSFSTILRTVLVFFLKCFIPIVLGFTVRVFWEPATVMDMIVFIMGYSLAALVIYAFIDGDVKYFLKKILNKCLPFIPRSGEKAEPVVP